MTIVKNISISEDVIFGDDVTIIEPVNLYGCRIGNSAFIGPFVEVQKNVEIGQYSRIQSHSFVCELVSIGDHCFIVECDAQPKGATAYFSVGVFR